MTMDSELDPRFCNAKKRSGERCKLRAGHGTSHVGVGPCKFHFGSTPTQERLAVAKLTEARSTAALAKLGSPKDTDPQAELLRQVGLAAARVDALEYQYELAFADWQQAATEDKPNRQAALDKLVIMWNAERVRAAKISKMAVDAGVARRHVEIAERQGTTIYVVMQNVLVQLGLPQDKVAEARLLLAGEFRRLAAEEQAS